MGMPPKYEGPTTRLSFLLVALIASVLVAVGLTVGSWY